MKTRLISSLVAILFVVLIAFAATDTPPIPVSTLGSTFPVETVIPGMVGDKSMDNAAYFDTDLSNLKLFGHDVFRPNPGATPANGNVIPIDYVLGAGDTVSIIVRGTDNTEYERTNVTISPEGVVSLKLIGNVPLANMSFDRARATLTAKYAEFYKAGQFVVTLEVTQRRTLSVYVLGEVVNPGQYTLPSLSTVFASLTAAGGPTDLGCIRQIKLSRANQADRIIDAYDFLLKGAPVDVQIENGDRIFVPMISEKAKLISIGGEVRRPAKYELLNEETMGRALDIAGGVTPNSSGIARLRRVDNATRNSTIMDLNIDDSAGYKILDGDQIIVRRVLTLLNGAVTIKGAVNRPGSYSIKQASTVAKLLALADGQTADAYVEQALITSMDVKTGARRQTAINVRAILAGTDEDVKLAPDDVLQVYKRSELPSTLMDVVWAKGAVLQPGSYFYRPGMRVSDLVRLALGTVSGAYLKQVHVMRYPASLAVAADGTLLRPSVILIDLEKALTGDKAEDIELMARDELQIYSSSELPSNLLDQVTVEGAIVRPKSYPYQNGMHVADLVKLALGPMPDAYLKQAQIYRYPSMTNIAGSKDPDSLQRSVINFDLSQALMNPLSEQNIQLQPRDLVKIVGIGDLPNDSREEVRVEGSVIHPGKFPIKTGMRVADLIENAYGLKIDAYLLTAELNRYPAPAIGVDTNLLQARVILVDLSKALVPGNVDENVLLQPRDVLKVYSRTNFSNDLLDIVRIDGQVENAGSYQYHDGMRVAGLIALAHGITTNAYMSNVQIYHYKSGEAASMDSYDMTDILKYDAKADVPGNVLLSPRDRVVIKSRADVTDLVVHVEGEVNEPKSLTYYKGMKVSDALFLAGGLKPDVALDHAFIMRLNEKTMKEEMLDISLRGVMQQPPDPSQNIELLNNDRLVIYSQAYNGDKSNVIIEGAVTSPGSYPFFGGMTVNNLVFLAKDLQQDSYSTRANLYRLLPDNTIRMIPINLLAARENPASADNILLQASDRLVVSKISDVQEPQIVKLNGFVRKAGEFPLSIGMKLSDAVALAGGLKPEAEQKLYLNRVGRPVQEIIATTGEKGMVVVNFDPFLQNNDLITVRENSEYLNMTKTVSVQGAVTHAGSFPAFNITRDNPVTLKQLLAKDGMAGGLLPTAYPSGIVLYRSEKAIRSGEQRLELSKILAEMDQSMGVRPDDNQYKTGDGQMTSDQINTQNVANMSNSLMKVLTTDQNSKVVMIVNPRSMADLVTRITIPINADEILSGKPNALDIALLPDDVIYVPERPTIVTILGGVFQSGSVLYTEGTKVEAYLNQCGGVADDGDVKRIVIMRMNGVVYPAKNVSKIQPGDIIIVPTKFKTNTVKTQSEFENAMRSVSQVALTVLGVARLF